jgi:hypothetical protein
MQHSYFESRSLPNHPPSTLGADIARHLQFRQYLGTSFVICDNPNAQLSATRKQWFKASRILQKQRASTLNTEEILRLTHAIMHMQNMRFTAHSPIDEPEADVFFVTPEHLDHFPVNCFSVYITTQIEQQQLEKLCTKIAKDGLIVNYDPELPVAELKLPSKSALEESMLAQWKRLSTFLQDHNIYPAHLVAGDTLQFAAMDEALDILLGASGDFLPAAADFQRRINLAQPLTGITSTQYKMFEAVTRLAHRVQALTPGNFTGYLSTTFGDHGADMFFLRDVASELYSDLEIEAAKFDNKK